MTTLPRIADEWVQDPDSQAVLSMIEGAGYSAYFVGGCVRNALLGLKVADIDIATDMLPKDLVLLSEKTGLKAIPTGIDHGTITIISGGVPHEVTTFRSDINTDGRRAEVAFSTSMKEDARRRDFTMNALYADANGAVFDPLGGMDDLRARRLRFIEDPAKRIEEDHLRSLRFFRFTAWYGDPDAGMDAEALAAIAQHLPGLETLSKERVGAEMLKLLAAPDPAPAVAAMASVGALRVVLPGAEPAALAPLVHFEQALDIAPDPLRRLSALGGEDVSQRLRLSRADARALDRLREGIAASADASELGYRFGKQAAIDMTLLRAALFQTPPAGGFQVEAEAGAAARFPIIAADLMPTYSGKALGARIAQLEALWIASGFALSREELLAQPPRD